MRGPFLMTTNLDPADIQDPTQLLVDYEQKLEQELPTPATVDMELVLKIIDLVPRHTWPAVLDAAVANIVDELPMETMFRMCELYLTDYYLQNPMEIIPDLIRIKGEESTLYILDSLQLDKIPAPKANREQEELIPIDNSPCSVNPE